MNRPMPQVTPSFRGRGMELKMASRTEVTERTMKSRPSRKTAARAICQE